MEAYPDRRSVSGTRERPVGGGGPTARRRGRLVGGAAWIVKGPVSSHALSRATSWPVERRWPLTFSSQLSEMRRLRGGAFFCRPKRPRRVRAKMTLSTPNASRLCGPKMPSRSYWDKSGLPTPQGFCGLRSGRSPMHILVSVCRLPCAPGQ